jgi:hypothetical protein
MKKSSKYVLLVGAVVLGAAAILGFGDPAMATDPRGGIIIFRP